jgi:hypothetical protein
LQSDAALAASLTVFSTAILGVGDSPWAISIFGRIFHKEKETNHDMKIIKLLWTLPAAALVGCVSHRAAVYSDISVTPTTGTAVVAPATAVVTPETTTVITPEPGTATVAVPTPPLTPTSVASDVRVYPEPKISITTPVPPPVTTTTLPGVIATSDPADIVVTEQIRAMLQADTAHVYRNIDFAVDKGKVSLRGAVPTDNDRIELQNRLAAIPGVRVVDNKLDVELR